MKGQEVIEWGTAGQALGGGQESGDFHVVVPFDGGVLVAVIDGLGHGPEAADAARAAARVLEGHVGEPVLALVARCHEELRRTRGAVMSLASFDARDSSMTAVGVGNVEVVLLRANPRAARPHEAILGRGGIVGYQLPPLRATALSVARDDTLIMTTDGIRSGFTTGLDVTRDPKELAASILAGYRTGSDDALVLVVRYRGGSGPNGGQTTGRAHG